eukprot:COSAG01_NODE_46917_length_395_cov_1.523649_2_plen_63_part_01
MIAISRFIITTTIKNIKNKNISTASGLVYCSRSDVPNMLRYVVRIPENGPPTPVVEKLYSSLA